MLPTRQVVFLASLDWDAAWQRHQVLAASFAEAGHEVFFVENTGFRPLRLSDLGRVLRRLANAFRRTEKRRVHPIPRGVRLIAPLVLPPGGGLSRLINQTWLLPALRRRLQAAGLGPKPLIFAYSPTRTTLDLIDLLEPRATVYDVVDHFAGHPQAPKDLSRLESELLRRASVVFTTSPLLQSLHENRHPRCVRIHHGVAEDFFLPARKPPAKHRRLCYFGTLRDGVDYAAVNALAEAGFEVALIGPEKDPVPPLHPSVKRPGMLPPKELAAALARFDALLLPYDDSDFNRGITPAKIYECLATGLPVLASPLPGLEEMKGLLSIARSPEEFVLTARGLDRHETPEKAAARVAYARGRSGKSQFRLILEQIEATLA